MNKLISSTQYFISVAMTEKASLAERIADKLEIGNTNTEFQQLFAHRQQIKQVIIGLEQLQWHLGVLKHVKPANHKQAQKLAVSLQKELAQLWRCTNENDEATRRSLDLAWQFVVDTSTTRTATENIGLAIFDDEVGEQPGMTVVEGDVNKVFNANNADAPEFNPVS